MDTELGHLGLSFYHWSDTGKYAQWLREYPDSVCKVMVTSYHEYLKDDIDGSRRGNIHC